MAKNGILLSVDKLMNIQNEISALTFGPFKFDEFLLLLSWKKIKQVICYAFKLYSSCLYKWQSKSNTWANEMVQWVKALASNSDNLSSTLRTHMMEGMTFKSCPLTSTNVLRCMLPIALPLPTPHTISHVPNHSFSKTLAYLSLDELQSIRVNLRILFRSFNPGQTLE